MAGRTLKMDVAYECGDAVNYQGCSGYVTAVVITDDRLVEYEVQLLDNNGQIVLGRFRVFELTEGHVSTFDR